MCPRFAVKVGFTLWLSGLAGHRQACILADVMDPELDSLDRFLTAQTPVISAIEEELRAGRKRTHWMWFVFPQLRGLGHSPTARFYGLADRAEAAAFLVHPVLGGRLRRCTALVMGVDGRTAHDIFGSPDDLKFRSCMTLFGLIEAQPFAAALDRFFAGEADGRTVALLG